MKKMKRFSKIYTRELIDDAKGRFLVGKKTHLLDLVRKPNASMRFLTRSLSIRRFFVTDLIRTRRPFAAAAADPDPDTAGRFPALYKWLSCITAAGSGIGFVLLTLTPSPPFHPHSSSITLASSSNSTSSPDFTSRDNANNSLAASDSENNSKFILGDKYRRRIFFNYEKRMRMRSPPEKVFDYFATHRSSDGEMLMTPADLMRAVIPVFPPSESNLVRDGYLSGEKRPGDLHCSPSEFFMLFDMNNDGLISFKEYIFFVTLLGIPESSFSVTFKMFDINNDGEIDRDEFKRVMALMRSHNRQGAGHSNGLRIGMKVDGCIENGGLVEYFFGKDGKDCLQHSKFFLFLRGLHEEILRLEFAHYDYKERGSIAAKDFALSMVASADTNHVRKLLDRVDDMNTGLADVRISFDEFKAFSDLRKQLSPFALALFTYGEVNKAMLTRLDFQRAASQVCGVWLSDRVMDVIFHVFDENKDGKVSVDEFVSVVNKPLDSRFPGVFSCCLNCITNPPLSTPTLLFA